MSDTDRPQSRGEEAQASPRTSFSFIGGHIGSVNTSSSVSPSTSSSSSSSTKTAVSECLSSWLNYLQILNSLCTAGFKLSQSLSTLAHCTPDQSATQTPLGMSGHSFSGASQPGLNVLSGGATSGSLSSEGISGTSGGAFMTGPPPLLPALTGWDELARSTAVATATVKCHIVALLQEYSSIPQQQHPQAEGAAEQIGAMRDNNYQIIADNISTLVNLQYQFCIACFECLSLADMCQCSSGEYPPQGMADSPKSAAERERAHYEHQHHGMPLHETARGGGGYHETPPPFRGPSPVEHPRGPSPIQGFLDTIRGSSHLEHMRGPLPNPGLLQGMKAPFHGGSGTGGASRGLRSPLHFPLFPLLQGQRRWSEAAAAEASGTAGGEDASMRRWSMPWDSAHVAAPHGRYHYYPPHYHHVTSHASGCHYPHPQHQAQISAGATARGLGAVGGVSKLSVPVGGGSGTTTSCSDRSRSTTPDSIWQPSSGSQDGLAEAIQLLSCRPGIRPYNQLTSQQQPSYHSHIQTTNQPPVPSQSSEPYHYHQDTGQMPFLYSMWSGHERSGLPFIRLPDMPEQQVLPDETGSSETKKQSSNVHKPP